jgi:hypothetical protein
MKTKINMLIASAVLVTFFSCQKDNSVKSEADLNIADDEAVSGAIFEDIFNTEDNASIIAEQMTRSGDVKSDVVVADSCPSITVTNPEAGSWPKTITIDYGEGCNGFYDNTRSGKIIIEITGPRLEEGSMRTLTFDNYYFNGIKVEGTRVTENAGYNENQDLVFSVTLTGGKLTLPDGRTVERSYQHQREWIAGLQTRNIWDDECLITGTASGTTIEGVAYTNTITTALHWTRSCFFIVSGVVKIERAGRQEVELSYGDGECDARAVVTMNGESKEILLRPRLRTMVR